MDLSHPLPRADFARFIALNAHLHLDAADGDRRSALADIAAETHTRLRIDSGSCLQGLPQVIGTAMEPYGWSWNGFYVLDEDGKLRLGAAFGPPVCSELERSGGPLSSGMCFDALMMNQTLATGDVDQWPGYVSCDGPSGLETASSIVAPIRDSTGRPIGVWDLDATQPIQVADVRFIDVLFATLARCLKITPESLA